MPRLLAAWRRARRSPPGPPDRLAPGELREVARAVQQLSQGLTRERSLAGSRYMDDPALLGAYLLFFWPVSYAQARQVMGELPHLSGAALDLASGPAPLAFAALDAGVREVTVADRSTTALAAARELAVDAGEALRIRQVDLTGAKPGQSDVGGPFDLISIGHGLNELYPSRPDAPERRAAMLDSWMGLLKEGGSLLIIDPALQEKDSTEQNAIVFSLQRGDVIVLTEAEARGDGLALSERSEIRIVSPAGRPVGPRSS